MHSFGHRSVSFASINQSINHITSITSTIVRARAETPSQRVPSHSMSAARWPRVYPLCVHACTPLHACTPGTHIPLPPPPSTVHHPSIGTRPRATRGGDITPPLPHHTKNEKQKQRAPPSPFKNATINTPRGRSSSYSTHPRVRPTIRAHPRARWITSDATSARRAGRVYRVHAPVTTHEKRRTHTDRAHPIGIGVVDAASSLESRVGSARRARAFDSLDALGRARALDTLHHRLLADRRASETSRARDADENPARRPTPPTDGDDRRRPTTTRMSRYGRKGVDTVRAGASRRERDDRSARGGATSRVARGPARASTTTATEA